MNEVNIKYVSRGVCFAYQQEATDLLKQILQRHHQSIVVEQREQHEMGMDS